MHFPKPQKWKKKTNVLKETMQIPETNEKQMNENETI
jgi:hypothetical protein